MEITEERLMMLLAQQESKLRAEFAASQNTVNPAGEDKRPALTEEEKKAKIRNVLKKDRYLSTEEVLAKTKLNYDQFSDIFTKKRGNLIDEYTLRNGNLFRLNEGFAMERVPLSKSNYMYETDHQYVFRLWPDKVYDDEDGSGPLTYSFSENSEVNLRCNLVYDAIKNGDTPTAYQIRNITGIDDINLVNSAIGVLHNQYHVIRRVNYTQGEPGYRRWMLDTAYE